VQLTQAVVEFSQGAPILARTAAKEVAFVSPNLRRDDVPEVVEKCLKREVKEQACCQPRIGSAGHIVRRHRMQEAGAFPQMSVNEMLADD
jgi:hypothetical protein